MAAARALAVMALSLPCIAGATNGAASLEVIVRGLHAGTGAVRIAVYDSAAAYLDEARAFRKIELPVTGGAVTTVFDAVPPGSYAVVLFQDLNANRKLDRNFIGVPSEPYGFSHDARRLFGPPTFDDARFVIGATNVTLEITVR